MNWASAPGLIRRYPIYEPWAIGPSCRICYAQQSNPAKKVMIMAEQILTGSCLCGALRYNVSGEPAQFWHCHCSRCRKATGTGHASNLFVKGGGIGWTGDTGLVKTFKLPDAKRFTRTFCAQCGGPLPREIPDMGLVMIPAGTLEDEPDIAPQGRIFSGSKAAWSCGGDDIPSFEHYPE